MKKLILFSCLAILLSCSENEADAPATFKVDSVSLETSSIQGTNSHKIKDLWMFLDGVDLGVFPIPAEIPVIPEDGLTSGILQFSPGVRNNGFVGIPIIYPFYETIFEEKNFVNGTCENIDLTFKYSNTTKFALVEEFEGGHGFGFDEDGDGVIGLTSSSTDVFEGNSSGQILLDENTLITEVASSISFDQLPLNGSATFMEMHYKTDVDLNVGLIGFLGNVPIKNYKLVLNPNEEWNKVYVDFTFDILNSQLDSYKIVLGAGIEEGDEPANVFVDNIKLLHF